MSQTDDRRRFPRVHAPVLCRPSGGFFRRAGRPVQDISMGGLRVFSDDPHAVGDRLELELFLPDGDSLVMVVEVVWVEALGEGSPAKFDVGMKFIQVQPETYLRLHQVLQPT